MDSTDIKDIALKGYFEEIENCLERMKVLHGDDSENVHKVAVILGGCRRITACKLVRVAKQLTTQECADALYEGEAFQGNNIDDLEKMPDKYKPDLLARYERMLGINVKWYYNHALRLSEEQ